MTTLGHALMIATLVSLTAACSQQSLQFRACERIRDLPASAQLTLIGRAGAWSMRATPATVTCGEPTQSAMACNFMGPATVEVSADTAPSQHIFSIAAGQMATVSISDGDVSCSLRSAE